MRSSVVLLSLVGLGATACYTPSQVFDASPVEQCPPMTAPPETLRVVSYNMHAGVSSSLDDIAAVLEELDADVVALQEVDRGVERTDFVDQDVVLAEKLGYHTAYAGARKRGDGDFGVAILSRFPFRSVERIDVEAVAPFQPRVALDASLCLGDKDLRVVAVHADIFFWAANAASRQLAQALEGHLGKGVIVAGDFNLGPDSEGVSILRDAGLVDVFDGRDDIKTFGGTDGRKIDYIFVDAPLQAGKGGNGVLERETSDHFPIFSDFDLATFLKR